MPLRVMLVEDEVLIALNEEGALTEAGFTVAGLFDTCAEALAALDRETFDAAVLDVTLRDGPCTELALRLREKDVPFVIYSAHRPGLAEPVLAEAPWIEKPLPFDLVVCRLKQVIGQSRKDASSPR